MTRLLEPLSQPPTQDQVDALGEQMPAEGAPKRFYINEHPHWTALDSEAQADLVKYVHFQTPRRDVAAKKAYAGAVIYPGVTSTSQLGIEMRDDIVAEVRRRAEIGLIPPEALDTIERSLQVLPGPRGYPKGGLKFKDKPARMPEVFLAIFDTIIRNAVMAIPARPTPLRVRRGSNPGAPWYTVALPEETLVLRSALTDPTWLSAAFEGDLDTLRRRHRLAVEAHATARTQPDPAGRNDAGQLTDGRVRTVSAYDGVERESDKRISVRGRAFLAQRSRTPIAKARVFNTVSGAEAHCREDALHRSPHTPLVIVTSSIELERDLNASGAEVLVSLDVRNFEANHKDVLLRRFCAWHFTGPAMYLRLRGPVLQPNDMDPYSPDYLPGTFAWTGHPNDIRHYPVPGGWQSGELETSYFNKMVGLSIMAGVAMEAGWPDDAVRAFLHGPMKVPFPRGYFARNAGDNCLFGMPRAALRGFLAALESQESVPYELSIEDEISFLGYGFRRTSGGWVVTPFGPRYLTKVWARERSFKVKNDLGWYGLAAQREFYARDPVGAQCIAAEQAVLDRYAIPVRTPSVVLDLPDIGHELGNLLLADPDRLQWDVRFKHLRLAEKLEALLGFHLAVPEDVVLRTLTDFDHHLVRERLA